MWPDARLRICRRASSFPGCVWSFTVELGRSQGRFLAILALALVANLVVNLGCAPTMRPSTSTSPLRDINAVLADHDDALMAIPGVVGVYVGLAGDGRTPCLKVMVARKDAALEQAIPNELEGYPVITEVTGEIRPLR